jgi:putative sterol carrier protein
MQELMSHVNSDKNFSDLRKTGRDATYTLGIEPEPENNIEDSFKVGFSIIGGKMNEVWTEETKTAEFTDLVVSRKYGVWVDMIRNRLRLTNALLSRKLSLGGETNQIFGLTVWMSPERLFAVELTRAAERIIEIARTIPTEFDGSYSSNTIRRDFS